MSSGTGLGVATRSYASTRCLHSLDAFRVADEDSFTQRPAEEILWIEGSVAVQREPRPVLRGVGRSFDRCLGVAHRGGMCKPPL